MFPHIPVKRKEDEQLGAKFEAARTCVHCKTLRSEHVQQKCLFDSTNFSPMTQEEWVAFELSQRQRIGGFRTHQVTGMDIANMRAVQKLEFDQLDEQERSIVVMGDEEPKK